MLDFFYLMYKLMVDSVQFYAEYEIEKKKYPDLLFNILDISIKAHLDVGRIQYNHYLSKHKYIINSDYYSMILFNISDIIFVYIDGYDHEVNNISCSTSYFSKFFKCGVKQREYELNQIKRNKIRRIINLKEDEERNNVVQFCDKIINIIIENTSS